MRSDQAISVVDADIVLDRCIVSGPKQEFNIFSGPKASKRADIISAVEEETLGQAI